MKAATASSGVVGMETAQAGIDFDALVKAEQKRIFMLCLRLLRDRDEAESATQDVFVEAYRARQNAGRSIVEPSKWLTRVALNACYDRIRSNRWRFWQRHSSSQVGDALLNWMPADGPNQEDMALAGDIRERLESALQRLSGRQRAVFILRHEEDLGIDEIAETMGLDTGTVKAHMARAIRKLRAELRDLYAR